MRCILYPLDTYGGTGIVVPAIHIHSLVT